MKAEDRIAELIRSGNPVALWGASKNNVNIINNVKSLNLSLCAIVDSDPNKYGKSFIEIPIMGFYEAIETYPYLYIWVADSEWKYRIIGKLTNELNFDKDRIINYEPVVWMKGCSLIENNIVCLTNDFLFCCEMTGRKKSPGVKYNGNCEETIEKFIEMKTSLSENIKKGEHTECDGCRDLVEDYFSAIPKISNINYSPGGICNLKCIYCNSPAKYSHGTWDKDYDFKEVLDTLKKKNVLSDSLHFDISPGETALNRNRKKYYAEFRKAQSTTVMTNATIYDEDLAECMKCGEANICVSVDAGTRETYKHIRGADLFDKLRENLKRYTEAAPGAVDLKYIFMPGENDTFEDADGFVDLCDYVKPSAAFLTYDIYSIIKDAPKNTVEVVKYLMKELENRGIMCKINSDVLKSALM